MKILICGKGGSGKSTLASLLSFEFISMGRKVILVDTDESNIGLHRLIGAEAPIDIMESIGGKKSFIEKLKENREVRIFENSFTLDSFEEEYVKTADGIRLVSIGKIHDFGEGCACPMGILAKQFISGLSVCDDEIVIVDTEAGIEHFGRGVEEGIDAIIMVIDPSYESLLLSEQVAGMVEHKDIPLYYVLNKVDDGTSTRIRKRLSELAPILGELPQDPDILMSGLEGQGLGKGHPRVAAIARAMLENK